MSVLIRGMEIPKSCANCEWSKLSKMDLGMSCFCTLAKKIGSLEIAKNNRLDFCPLIPVPPHGRLIDADNIGLTNFEIILCQKGNPYKNALEMLLKKIENAPTIIQTEKGEI